MPKDASQAYSVGQVNKTSLLSFRTDNSLLHSSKTLHLEPANIEKILQKYDKKFNDNPILPPEFPESSESEDEKAERQFKNEKDERAQQNDLIHQERLKVRLAIDLKDDLIPKRIINERQQEEKPSVHV